MNWSLVTADRATYRKVVAIALLGTTLISVGAIFARSEAISLPALSEIRPSLAEEGSC